MIAYMMTNRKLLDGTPIPENVRLMTACNPFRIKSREAMTTTTGLTPQYKPKPSTNVISAELEYRVFPIPESLLHYIWDFGSLPAHDERGYIKSMIMNCMINRSQLVVETTTDLLCKFL